MTVDAQAERFARAFHEAYERLAPSFGYETREASAVPWEEVPEPNRSLMIAVAAEVCGPLAARLEAAETALRSAQAWHEALDYDEALNVIDAALAAAAPSPADQEETT